MSGFPFYLVLSLLLGVDLPAQVSVARNARSFPLRKLDIQPSTAGLRITAPEGTLLNDDGARSIAREAEQQLRTQGYSTAEVGYELAPLSTGKADLHLHVKSGNRVRVTQVDFAGDLGVSPQELRKALRELRARRLIGGWKLLPAYSPEAVQADLARLRSLYLSKGYFDATVRVDNPELHEKDARIRFAVDSGARHDGLDTPALCASLMSRRRAAQREGILEFTPTLHVPSLAVSIENGEPYRVGRIEFRGNHRHSQEQIRRNLLLGEGELFDEALLRKSIARLNRTMLFEPIDENHITIRTDAAAGGADIGITLTERKRGAWGLSGPVGPASFAGPLQASVSSRLPAWGSGLLDLSMFTASISISAFARPIVPALAIAMKRPLFPVLALQRPFTPADGWRSGFAIIPQLGWRATALSYPATQLQQRLLPRLAGDHVLVPALPVKVEGARDGAVLYCEPPSTRFPALRTGASLTLRLAGALTGL